MTEAEKYKELMMLVRGLDVHQWDFNQTDDYGLKYCGNCGGELSFYGKDKHTPTCVLESLRQFLDTHKDDYPVMVNCWSCDTPRRRDDDGLCPVCYPDGDE